MKNSIFVIIGFVTFLHCIMLVNSKAQNYNENNSESLLDLKLEILDAKLKLLDSRLEYLNSQPWWQYEEIQKIDSIYDVLSKKTYDKVIDTFKTGNYKSTIKLNPMRLFEGTFQISFEKAINKKWSYEIAGLATYVTEEGLGGGYFARQNFSAYDAATKSYSSYSGKIIKGWGIIFQTKNYLLYKINTEINAPVGLYAAPQLMYRKISITGNDRVWDDSVYVNKDIIRNLDILRGGVILGGNFVISKVLCIDIYIGGVMRLSKYTNEPTVTKYKGWKNIDYTGVLPTAGISLGILR